MKGGDIMNKVVVFILGSLTGAIIHDLYIRSYINGALTMVTAINDNDKKENNTTEETKKEEEA